MKAASLHTSESGWLAEWLAGIIANPLINGKKTAPAAVLIKVPYHHNR
jgi:hypothetical protein